MKCSTKDCEREAVVFIGTTAKEVACAECLCPPVPNKVQIAPIAKDKLSKAEPIEPISEDEDISLAALNVEDLAGIGYEE